MGPRARVFMTPLAAPIVLRTCLLPFSPALPCRPLPTPPSPSGQSSVLSAPTPWPCMPSQGRCCVCLHSQGLHHGHVPLCRRPVKRRGAHAMRPSVRVGACRRRNTGRGRLRARVCVDHPAPPINNPCSQGVCLTPSHRFSAAAALPPGGRRGRHSAVACSRLRRGGGQIPLNKHTL